MRCVAALFVFLLGCSSPAPVAPVGAGGVVPSVEAGGSAERIPPVAPVEAGDSAGPVAPVGSPGLGVLAPPSPPPQMPAPPAPAAPATPLPGVTPVCPTGMLAVDGGPARLGEKDKALLAKYGPNAVVPPGDYLLSPFCIDVWPLPGGQGSPWPTDGLNKAQIRGTIEPMLWEHGRRLCTVAELMYASGGTTGARYPWGESPSDQTCDIKDDMPDAMGSHPDCVSPLGVREFQVRSTWARLDATTLDALTLAGAAPQPGFDGGYAVWGGLMRDDTYYAPTNFGVHFHLEDAAGFNDDGLRTCAWSGAIEAEQQARWETAMARLTQSRLLGKLAD